MKIFVCIGHVPDTTTKVKFNKEMTKFDETEVQWIINPWDELALTRALELKEQYGSVIEKVIVINVGKVNTEPTIRKALAMGADEGIRVDAEPVDSYVTAAQLAEALKQESFDLIFCGIEASDYNSSAVGSMLSEFLQIPSVSSVSFIDIVDRKITVKREIEGGKETISIEPPVVIIAQKGFCIFPRIPSMRGIMTARTKPLKVVQPITIEPLIELKNFELPTPKAKCKMFKEDEVDKFIEALHKEAKVL